MRDPYRPHSPAPDPELARLAKQGQQRRMEMAAAQRVETQQAGGRHLRTAIGAYRGSTIKRLLFAFIVVFALTGAVGIVLGALGETEMFGWFLPSFFIAFASFMIWVFVPPIATQGAIAAEQAWARALPFQLVGYFEFLSEEPQAARTVAYEIIWQEGARPADPALLHGIFGAVDPHARLGHTDMRRAQVFGGAVSGVTGIRINRRPVYRNHRLPAHVHAVIEQVLLPLHRSHSIARVTLTRG